ncbi:hypothetical protein [Acinetobacter pseudolwoffii]|uniref:Uncharacterized protein n=1 Tax=Acinetobacter pseudolwoffii TaxID=2053287 RepID=A0A2H9UPF3_9GAMM|nr:hypothetical protein [Acinetobacter pseudolwoffii]PJI33570.1 hypothetical protein CU320_04020 [Acinetobacter pseudolwoffii]
MSDLNTFETELNKLRIDVAKSLLPHYITQVTSVNKAAYALGMSEAENVMRRSSKLALQHADVFIAELIERGDE